MVTSKNNSPESMLDDDPGDETARRYGYQWVYSAVLCCGLIDETQKITEVICEHHEDILIKDTTGAFSAIQVKTRNDNSEPWKASDEALVKAFCRFVRLDNKFPDFFVRFVFASNHPGYASKNGKDISFILEKIKESKDINQLEPTPYGFCKKLSDKTGLKIKDIYETLGKCRAQFNLPKIADIHIRLMHSLELVWEPAKNISFSELKSICESIIQKCAFASSKKFSDDNPWYINPTQDDMDKWKDEIESKKINKEVFINILKSGEFGTPLLTTELSQIKPLNFGKSSLLRQKLNAGGFSAFSIQNAEDLKNKAEYLGYRWSRKFGPDQGMSQVEHIRTIVTTDAAKAYEATRSQGDPFGTSMLEKLDDKFEDRSEKLERELNCTPEHLSGFAYSQTSQCKIQWSNAQPWKDDESLEES